MIWSVGFSTEDPSHPITDEYEAFRTMDGAAVLDANAPTIEHTNEYYQRLYFQSIINDPTIPF